MLDGLTLEKKAAISALIMAAYEKCGDIRAATDAVLGEGTSARMTDDLYYSLRAKAGLPRDHA